MSFRDRFLEVARALRARLAAARWKILAVVFGLGAVFLAYLHFEEDYFAPSTYGSVWIDSPEIYTRERLVNDRFLQDAWLTRQLQSHVQAEASYSSSVDTQYGLRAHAGNSARSAAGDGKGAGEGKGDHNGATLAPSQRDRLTDAVDFRDQVRSLLIENQLDDRHDLKGNTLYRLKFDATVLPGRRTRSHAEIHIVLIGPSLVQLDLQNPDSEVANRWRPVYHNWLDSLRTRLNQTHKELKQGFHTNELQHNEYARLIQFVGTHGNTAVGEVSQCKDGMAAMRAPADRARALKLLDHEERKKCIYALVARNLAKRHAPAQKGAPVTGRYNPSLVPAMPDANPAAPPLGTYMTSPGAMPPAAAERPALPQAASAAPSCAPAVPGSPQALDHELDRRLNEFFASKAVQLVLGLVVPEANFVSRDFINVPALERLTQLTFFNPDTCARDSNVFNVLPRRFDVMAIDAGVMNESAFNEASLRKPSPLEGRSWNDFTAKASAGSTVLAASLADLKPLENTGVGADTLRFRRHPDAAGVWTAQAEVGLVMFAQRAHKNTRAYTYAVTPKENADTARTSYASEVEMSAAVQPPAGGERGVQGNLHRKSVASALNRRGTVVGYGSATGGESEVQFGWVIGPRYVTTRGGRPLHVQSAAQYSLSALLSLPSWWDKVDIEVTTSWIDDDGKRHGTYRRDHGVRPGTAAANVAHADGRSVGAKASAAVHSDARERYSIELPTDFEPLEAILLQSQLLGPELMDSRLDPVLLTACQPGSIIIPGRRLWRSTVVTVGYQPADEITVLPNMKGIIAKFKVIENQAGQLELNESRPATGSPGHPEIQRTVRVWTSQGTIALPIPARIGIPDRCPRKEEAK